MRPIFSSFLIFCCYFTHLRVREISQQNLRNSENIGHTVPSSNRAITNAVTNGYTTNFYNWLSRCLYEKNCHTKVRRLTMVWWISVQIYMMRKFFSPITANLSTEAATGGVLCEKVFIEISQNSQKNTCAIVFFLIKFQAC